MLFQFTKEAVVETYIAFINNWKTAKDAIKLAKGTRPNIAKFLEVSWVVLEKTSILCEKYLIIFKNIKNIFKYY